MGGGGGEGIMDGGWVRWEGEGVLEVGGGGR